ncbi:MAG: alpha/beta hydrolase [Proteobacteria bacterium]|nr:alpha/beta hydrolase [Pseudomonadota bacterium]MCP4918592.1 alpha/beta hydrolase [Pseudomonadota bacterium]
MHPEHPSDPPVQQVQLANGPLGYTDEGHGPTVLLVHGYPGGLRDWRWLAPALPGHRLVRIQLPGLNDSTPLATNPGTSIPARVECIEEAIDALGLTSYAVAGHSMGGGLVQVLAERRAEQVTHLLLVSSIGHRPHKGIRAYPAGFIAKLVGNRCLDALTNPMGRMAFRAFGFPSYWSDEARRHTTLCAADLDWSLLKNAASHIRCPTLIAFAEDDPLVEPAIGEELIEALPDGPRLRWPDGGHNVQKAHATELGATICAFLNTRSRTP